MWLLIALITAGIIDYYIIHPLWLSVTICTKVFAVYFQPCLLSKAVTKGRKSRPTVP